jgi:hypothetical protein
MENLTITEAKEQLEDLIERASKGETVVIQGAGGQNVTLRAAPGEAANLEKAEGPKFGQFAGRYKIPGNVFEPMTDADLRDWYGEAP